MGVPARTPSAPALASRRPTPSRSAATGQHAEQVSHFSKLVVRQSSKARRQENHQDEFCKERAGNSPRTGGGGDVP